MKGVSDFKNNQELLL